jgi:L-ornithine N5-monooxygenase
MAGNNDEHGYDLIGIGFGVAALSLAIGLQEMQPGCRVLFLERQSADMWQRYAAIPSFNKETTFLQDLATQRNPRSRFTFTNFLHESNKLLDFLNISRLSPSPQSMKEYLAWSASHFKECVRYNHEAVSIEPLLGRRGSVESWSVLERDVCTGEISSISAKKVVLAVGAQPHIPISLNNIPSRVLHSSKSTDSALEDFGRMANLNIAVVGQNQEAAKIFRHLSTTSPHHKVSLFIPSAALRPKETTPLYVEVQIFLVDVCPIFSSYFSIFSSRFSIFLLLLRGGKITHSAVLFLLRSASTTDNKAAP